MTYIPSVVDNCAVVVLTVVVVVGKFVVVSAAVVVSTEHAQQHWLLWNVPDKAAVLVWKCLHDAAPRYLADLCVPAASTDGRRLSRSAVSGPCWCPGLGLLLASAALLRMAPGPGTE